jgi:hypothetical protein
MCDINYLDTARADLSPNLPRYRPDEHLNIIHMFTFFGLKGLSHEMDLAFDDMYGFSGLNRGRGHFLNF